ncbi:MAG: hypothetical protein ABI759_25355 [Candidatus Solibacter sp.]
MQKLTLCGLFIGLTGILGAQEMHRFSVTAGAGFTSPVGRTSDIVDTGWNVRAGLGVNFHPHVGLMLDVGYDSMGVRSPILNNLGFGGGSLSVFSATLNPVVHILPTGPVDVYLTGGGGLYRQSREFTQPGVERGVGFDPFFGYYPYASPVDVVVSSYSVVKPGVDGGMGIAFGSKWGGKFFAEARYNRIFLRNRHTDYVPVTFGFRW